MKIVIPMAGEGSRFSEAGYSLPKPLIDVEGKPMIQRVIENLQFGTEFVFLVRKKHLTNFPLENILKQSAGSSCKIVQVDKLTEGAACTILLAEEYIDNGEPFAISNCDELLEYSLDNFRVMSSLVPGGNFIWVFRDTDPKWSFVRTNEHNEIVEVAEKRPISDLATCGVYHWAEGRNFVAAAKKMITKNIRVNNEFYTCPVYNEAIEDGSKVYPFFVEKMHGLGTPEDLERYLNR